MLPELFQEEEKAISPTSATSSGRTPLTRVPVKPTKGRPGQMAKEHKKTVGHQVSSGAAPARLVPFSSHKVSGLASSALWTGSSAEERPVFLLCKQHCPLRLYSPHTHNLASALPK